MSKLDQLQQYQRFATEVHDDTPPGTLTAIADTGEIIAPFFRTGYNYNRDAASDEAGLACLDPSLTQQQFAEDADINVIVRRFNLTGTMPENLRMPDYGDFAGVNNLQDALNIARQAREQFMLIPPEVRAEFNNDPHVFMEAVHDERNLPRLRELGLAKPLGLPDQENAPKGASTASAVTTSTKEEKPPQKEAKEQSSP